ncbi:MAG: hypothetical protein ACI934_001500, partial [Pseudohongiellaceae bacterium]
MDLESAKSALLTKQQELMSRVERTHKHIYEKDEPVSAKFSEQAAE